MLCEDMENKMMTLKLPEEGYQSILHIGNIKINCTKHFNKLQRKMWLKYFGVKITPYYEEIK